MLPHLTLRQFLELAEYHAIVGKPGVDHADVPLAILATAVVNALSEDSGIEPWDLMEHLAPPDQTPEEIFNQIRRK